MELILFFIVLLGFFVLADVLFAPRVTKESTRKSIGEENRRKLMREYISKGV